MRNAHCRTWIMVRKLKKLENLEVSTVGRGIWQENSKKWKMRQKHNLIWNIVRNTEKGEK